MGLFLQPLLRHKKQPLSERLLFVSRAEGSPTLEGLCKKDAVQ